MNGLATLRTSTRHAFLEPPYDGWWEGELLAHFRARDSVHYFPLSAGKPKHLPAADRLLGNEFDLNNEVHRLPEPLDWRTNPSHDLEWAILLHKFYFARDLALAFDFTHDERYARKWVALLDSWIAQIPDGYIDSQVTGRRLQQWLLSFQYFIVRNQSAAVTPEFLIRFLRSVASQVHYLTEHLTPEGNHRTLEISAIFFIAVAFPEIRGSQDLQAFAIRELLANMAADLLPDGAQRELSTDYHHTVLKNYLRASKLAKLNGIALPDEFEGHIRRALEFSLHAHKPDGTIPALSDGDCNSYLSLLKNALEDYPDPHLEFVCSAGERGQAPRRSRSFPASGYTFMRSDWTAQPYSDGHYMAFDCGPLGFGSHGHYDLLSIEAAAFGHSLVVDPGRYTYSEASDDGINWRHWFKGTRAHNTVMVDGKDQAAYHPYAMEGPEPRAEIKRFVSAEGFDFVHGRAVSPEYDVVHERAIFFALPDYWVVTDFLDGHGEHRYDLRFHLAPRALNACRIDAAASGVVVESPNLILAQPAGETFIASIERDFVSPEYGVKTPAPVVRFSGVTIDTATVQTVLYPFKDAPPRLAVNSLPVRDGEQAAEIGTAVALSVHIGAGSQSVCDQLFVARRPAKTGYAFADIHCRAELLFVRRDRGGRVLRFHAEGLEWLQIGGRTLIGDRRIKHRVSCRDGWLEAACGSEIVMVALADCGNAGPFFSPDSHP